MKLIAPLALSIALAARLGAEPYVAAAGGPAWMKWFDTSQSQVTRFEAAMGWRFSPQFALETAMSTGGFVHTVHHSSTRTLIGFAPGAPDPNTAHLIDSQRSRKNTAWTVGPVLSLPLGPQFALVSRQHVAFVANALKSDERIAFGPVQQLPNLPNTSRTVRRETIHHVRWQPTAGLKWKPSVTSRCEFSVEAVHLDAAEVTMFAALVRGSVRF